MQRFSTAFRERSVTDIKNKRDAQMLQTKNSSMKVHSTALLTRVPQYRDYPFV